LLDQKATKRIPGFLAVFPLWVDATALLEKTSRIKMTIFTKTFVFTSTPFKGKPLNQKISLAP
jgi:hypothetical protein